MSTESEVLDLDDQLEQTLYEDDHTEEDIEEEDEALTRERRRALEHPLTAAQLSILFDLPIPTQTSIKPVTVREVAFPQRAFSPIVH